jgi:hypothetical protein
MPALRQPLLLTSIALGALSLAACENPRADAALSAQQGLVGMPKAILLQCAGVPTRSANADGLEILTYDTQKLQADPNGGFYGAGGWGWGRPWGWGGAGWGWGGGGTQSRSCSATFTIKDGKIFKLVYGSSDSEGVNRYDQCYAIVENCLSGGGVH